MVRSFRRGGLAAVLALSLAPLTACAAGSSSQTLHIKPNNAEVTKGSIQVQNAWVLTQASGPATVSARLFNNGASTQTLQAVQIAGGLVATLKDKNGGSTVTVPAHGTVLLGGQGNPAAVLNSGAETLRNGDVQNAVFVFSSSGAVSLPINVTPAAGFFEPYGPGSLAPSTPPSPTATPGTTTPGSTATPTGTASPGAGSGKGHKSTKGATAGSTATPTVTPTR